MKIKKIAATLGLIVIVGSSLTATAITKQTATGYFEGWTTWFGAGTVNSEHVDYANKEERKNEQENTYVYYAWDQYFSDTD